MKEEKKDKKIVIQDGDPEEEAREETVKGLEEGSKKEAGEEKEKTDSPEKGDENKSADAEEAEGNENSDSKTDETGNENADETADGSTAESETGEAPGDKRDGIIADLKDKFQRQLAEFENFRKRTEKEKNGMFEAGSRNVIEKILPVVDNFERALESPPEDEASKAFTEGVEMIYKQLMQELEKLGTERIDAVGKPFDPEFHNAVMQEPSEEYESGTVIKELQKGYTYHGTVVRHSMVSVAE
ncbi:MAG: nucleotide exchange factor GrpE [Lachnospiraceae bacterium]|nr:nucleotide exchange factor GrpE [Lachnospiraceae bacterium]